MHVVYESPKQHCVICKQPLLALAPPMEGWQFYCPQCGSLTVSVEELDKQVLADSVHVDGKGLVGYVCQTPKALAIARRPTSGLVLPKTHLS